MVNLDMRFPFSMAFRFPRLLANESFASFLASQVTPGSSWRSRRQPFSTLAFFWGLGGLLRMSVTEDALFRAIEGMQAASKKPWYALIMNITMECLSPV